MNIRGTIEGLDVIVGGLEEATLEVREAAFQGVLLAMNAAFKACQTTISADDHSLKDLAEMGHPYGFTRPQLIHDPDVIVHIQSGDYLRSLKRTTPSGSGGDIIDGEIFSDSPLDGIIQGGSSHMRSRPWMKFIVDNYGDDFADIIEARILQAIRAA